MQKYASVHPVIYKIVEQQKPNFIVHEKLRIGFFNFSFTYPIKVFFNTQTSIVQYKATVFGMSHIDMDFSLKNIDGKTQVDEIIQIKSVLPIKAILRNIFKTQHTLLFKNIELDKAENLS